MIKFRGKRTDTGEWVYGAYIHNGGRPYIISHEIAEVCDEYIHPAWWCPVDPKTFGQYTGLTDKNGKEIYEGDVLSWGPEDFAPDSEVFFSEGAFWVFGSCYDTSELLMDVLLGSAVIGNIHDNPGLLGVG